MSEFAVEAHSLRKAFGGARPVRADELLDSFGLKPAADGGRPRLTIPRKGV